MKVFIITIGDELLIGQVIDTNSAKIARMLQEAGGEVVGKSTVGDSEQRILDVLQNSLPLADVILMTGGLGPTKDDMTKNAIATFFGVGMQEHSSTRAFVEDSYRHHQRTITEAVTQQWMVPQNATVLPNKMGTAPGLWLETNGKVVVAMPGVPFEMEYLMQQEVLPRLKERYNGSRVATQTILLSGEGESTIAKMLENFEDRLPENVSLAYLPRPGQVRLRLTVHGNNPALNQQTLHEKLQEMIALLPPELIASLDDDVIESAIGKVLQQKGLSVGTAESCTGGFVAHLLTSIPGSSAYFKGSVIAYANETKMKLLNVREITLAEHGAVSEQTAVEMASGALRILGTDLVIATTGIAGPDGGTPEKPVGTVWVAVGNGAQLKTRLFQFRRDRLRNIEYTAVYALEMLRRFVLKHYPD